MRAHPFGERSVLLDLEIDALSRRADRTFAALAALQRRLPLVDLVPGAGTILLVGLDPWTDLTPLLAEASRAAQTPAPPAQEQGPLLVPVVYDGADLVELSAALRMEIHDIVKLHAGSDYEVELLGFLPGFAYLGPVTGPLALPRRTSPRPAVPARSVAVAAGFTGIYPNTSPGGWHLLGRAPSFRPFPGGQPLLSPGRRVRFFSAEEAALLPEDPPAQLATTPTSLRVLAAPACATVQDRGRGGKLGIGLPPSGPLDPTTFAAVNLKLGNDAGAAALEIPQGSLEVEARGALWVCVDGEEPQQLADGERLRLPTSKRAVRYLAVEGGVGAPLLLGSRATLPSARLGGLGGRPLKRGAVIPVVGGRGRPVPGVEAGPEPESPAVLTMLPGPHLDHFYPEVLDILTGQEFSVSRLGDRVGVRLDGPRLPLRGGRLQLPVPMLRGTIEVSTDGTPIVLGPDHPVTGGYPVVGVLTANAQAKLARLWPGHPVRFALA